MGTYGGHASLTVAMDGLPLISYYDNDLRTAKCGNGSCSSGNTLATVDTSGIYTSITIASDGLPVISYYKNSSLNVAKCANQFCLDKWIRR